MAGIKRVGLPIVVMSAALATSMVISGGAFASDMRPYANVVAVQTSIKTNLSTASNAIERANTKTMHVYIHRPQHQRPLQAHARVIDLGTLREAGPTREQTASPARIITINAQ
jgi:hypothetical protein